MHILIATPLYPPDIAGHAPYVKELAKRLKKDHMVTVLLYGNFPEKIDGVNLIVIPKQQPAFIRLLKYTITLINHGRASDIIYLQNGPSVELPMLCAKMFLRSKPFILNVFDVAAFAYTNKVYDALFTFVTKQSHYVFTYENTKDLVQKSIHTITLNRVLPRPEILPLSPYPTEAFVLYNSCWEKHIEKLITTFRSLCKIT